MGRMFKKGANSLNNRHDNLANSIGLETHSNMKSESENVNRKKDREEGVGELVIKFSESERSDTSEDLLCFGLSTRQVPRCLQH